MSFSIILEKEVSSGTGL